MVKVQLLNRHDGMPAVSARNFEGQVHVRVLPIGMNDYLEAERAYRSGELVQKAFAKLSDDDREFLLNGSTPEQTFKLYGPEDPDNPLGWIDIGSEFMTTEQYQAVYSGQMSLDAVYRSNKKRLTEKYAEADLEVCP